MNKYTVIMGIVFFVLWSLFVAAISYGTAMHQRELDVLHGLISTEVAARKELELVVRGVDSRVKRIEDRRGASQ